MGRHRLAVGRAPNYDASPPRRRFRHWNGTCKYSLSLVRLRRGLGLDDRGQKDVCHIGV